MAKVFFKPILLARIPAGTANTIVNMWGVETNQLTVPRLILSSRIIKGKRGPAEPLIRPIQKRVGETIPAITKRYLFAAVSFI